MSDKIKPCKRSAQWFYVRLLIVSTLMGFALMAFIGKQEQKKVADDQRARILMRTRAYSNATLTQKRSDKITLSIVMATRVDSYGGASSFQRMQNTLNMINHYACINVRLQSDVRIEIIVVEYNPLKNVKRIRDVLTLPSCVFKLRIITVPRSYHRLIIKRNGYKEDWVVWSFFFFFFFFFLFPFRCR
jgi:hypothetical protein